MNEEKLIIGMPAGSLANTSRGGNIIQLLKNAGFETRGYEEGGPTDFKSVGFLFGWDGRPQEFGSQLGIQELDVAIAGGDWIKERILELRMEYNTNLEIEEVLPLKRGYVRIVGIVSEDSVDNADDFFRDLCRTKKIITVVSEMPYLALNWVQERLRAVGKYEEFKQFTEKIYEVKCFSDEAKKDPEAFFLYDDEINNVLKIVLGVRNYIARKVELGKEFMKEFSENSFMAI